VANAPFNAPLNDLAYGRLRKGFGLDPIKSDLPYGSAASIFVHGGILFAALFAWQATPPIMPEDVIAVDMVSDTLSVKGAETAPETAQTGVDTPTPSPLPQTSLPVEGEVQAAPPFPQEMQQAEIAPAPPSQTPLPSPSLPLPPASPPPKAAAAVTAPAPRPLPKPAPAQRAIPQPTAKAAPTPPPKAKQPAPTARRQDSNAAPMEFDLAAASTAATGADSGGRRTPQLAARGQAGRLGKAGGGAELTGDLEAALRAQLKVCWNPPANMSNPRELIVVVSIDIGIDGNLLRQPTLVSPASTYGASQRLIVAIDNALNAVRTCAPFNLPPDRYEAWRQVRFKFDPELMARR
jgi:outer membrane biosynthesis protein TonB